MKPCAYQRLVDRHFGLRIDPEGERELRAHLGGCDLCRGRYERQLVLAGLDPKAATPQERLSRGLGFRKPASKVRWLAALGTATALAAAWALLPLGNEGFVARGGPARLPSVVAYRLDAGISAPLLREVGPAEELAFAYSNPRGHKYLMIFGVDEHRHVYWYYPAWTDAAGDPQAVTIETAPGPIELPEAITQKLDGRRLTLHMLLLDEPARVREVEARLSDGGASLPGAEEETLELEVRQ